jgi:hypothetical protein
MQNSVADSPKRKFPLQELLALFAAVRQANPYEAADKAAWTSRWVDVAVIVGDETTAEFCHAQYEEAVLYFLNTQQERGPGAWPASWPRSDPLRELLDVAAAEWHQLAKRQGSLDADTGSRMLTTSTPAARSTTPSAAPRVSSVGAPRSRPFASDAVMQRMAQFQPQEIHTPRASTLSRPPAPVAAARPLKRLRRFKTVLVDDDDSETSDDELLSPLANESQLTPTDAASEPRKSVSSPRTPSRGSEEPSHVTPDNGAVVDLGKNDVHYSTCSRASSVTLCTTTSAQEATAAREAAAAVARRFAQPAKKKKLAFQRPSNDAVTAKARSRASSPPVTDVIATDQPLVEITCNGEELEHTSGATVEDLERPLAKQQLDSDFSPPPIEESVSTGGRSVSRPKGAARAAVVEPRSLDDLQPASQSATLLAALEAFAKAERSRQRDAKKDCELVRALLDQQKQLLDEKVRHREREHARKLEASRLREQHHNPDMAIRHREVEERVRVLVEQRREREQQHEAIVAALQCLQEAHANLHAQREDLRLADHRRRAAATDAVGPTDEQDNLQIEVAQLREEIHAERDERMRAFAVMYEAIHRSLGARD